MPDWKIYQFKELVERILSLQSPERETYFLEVGSGSGAISVALLSKLQKVSLLRLIKKKTNLNNFLKFQWILWINVEEIVLNAKTQYLQILFKTSVYVQDVFSTCIKGYYRLRICHGFHLSMFRERACCQSNTTKVAVVYVYDFVYIL